MARIKISSGKKIDLLVLDKKDIDLLHFWMNNLEVNKYLANRKDIYYKEDIEKIYNDSIEENDSLYFSIYNKKFKKVIWICWIKNIKDLSSQWELYLFIYRSEDYNKWYWTESVELNMHLKYYDLISYIYDI